MTPLPPYHLARPRLTDRCLDSGSPVVVVEAAAGYGKTVLAAELVREWGCIPIDVRLDEGPVSAKLLVGRICASVARAGFVDAAGQMRRTGEDPPGAIDTVVAALAGEACAFVIDDAHHVTRDAGLLLERMASEVAAPQRLVILARRLPAGTERLRRAGPLHLSATDLALSPEETVALCRSGFGLDVSAEEGRLLDAATAGWTAATVLTASRAQHGARALRDLLRPPTGGGSGSASARSVASILDDLLSSLGTHRDVLARVAPLPLISPDLLADVTGDPDFFERAVALGLPLTPVGEDWWGIPGPVRDHFASLGPPDPATLLTAARHYVGRGRLSVALEMLLGAESFESAAVVLAGIDLRAVETIDPLELLAQFERIPDAVRDRHPWAGFHVARACGIATFIAARARLLARLCETVSADDDPELRRAIDAEVAIDLINVDRPDDAVSLGRSVLASVHEGEQFTRARALVAIGFGLCLHRDGDGRLSPDYLREAARHLDEASEIYASLNYRDGATAVVPPRAIWTELGLGRPLAALELLDAGLAACAGRDLRVGRLLCNRADVLGELGRFDEAEVDLAEAERIGHRSGDRHLVAYAHWFRMIHASMRGDAAATLQAASEVEAHRGEWWSAVGGNFLAESADCLDRVGYTAQAADALARARTEPHVGDRFVALAECALLARHGDPVLAEERLAEVATHGIFPKEYWRVTLLRANAAWRRGDPSAGTLAARAFEEAARMGQPQAPLIREREVTESLLGLAVETGSAFAEVLQATSLPHGLTVLGRFELTRGGRPVALGAGQAAQLLKVIAVHSGRIHVERAMEALWPGSDPAAARNRLRTVLGRLNEVAPDVVERTRDLLVLADDVHLDLTAFEREAREALHLAPADHGRAVALARSAITRYRGELLPDDLYEEWADAPRERTRRIALDLLDLCAEAAARRGDLDDARRLVERTIELAPYDDDRYLRVAAILEEQGRHGAALSVLRRARSTLATLGIELPDRPVARLGHAAGAPLDATR